MEEEKESLGWRRGGEFCSVVPGEQKSDMEGEGGISPPGKST